MQFDWNVLIKYWPLLAKGFWMTLYLCTASLALGLVIGLVGGLMRAAKNPWLRIPAQVYIEIIRDTPFLVQVFIVYFVLPFYGLRFSSTGSGLFALTVYAGAYVAEIIRGGIQAVPRGQVEAARSLGMSHMEAMRRIVLPQIWGFTLPPLTNQYISLIKESSLLSIITVPELTFAGQSIMGRTFSPIEAYFAITMLYWLINSVLAGVSFRLERHLTAYR
jgi:polar amino acid transport system permease protein